MLKLCPRCGYTRDEESFTLIKTGEKAGKRYTYCRECERNKDRQRKDKSWEVRKLQEDKTQAERVKRWKESNPEKVKAHRLAQKHIPIPEGTICAYCEKRLAKERHHPDYNRPLHVDFLCNECHNKTKFKDDSTRPDDLTVAYGKWIMTADVIPIIEEGKRFERARIKSIIENKYNRRVWWNYEQLVDANTNEEIDYHHDDSIYIVVLKSEFDNLMKELDRTDGSHLPHEVRKEGGA